MSGERIFASLVPPPHGFDRASLRSWLSKAISILFEIQRNVQTFVRAPREARLAKKAADTSGYTEPLIGVRHRIGAPDAQNGIRMNLGSGKSNSSRWSGAMRQSDESHEDRDSPCAAE